MVPSGCVMATAVPMVRRQETSWHATERGFAASPGFIDITVRRFPGTRSVREQSRGASEEEASLRAHPNRRSMGTRSAERIRHRLAQAVGRRKVVVAREDKHLHEPSIVILL